MELKNILLDAIAAPAFVERPALVLAALLVIGLVLVMIMVVRNERK